MRVAVFGIEPIEPAVGGSRQRLKGVYHGLGAGIDVTYVGAFHWRGPAERRVRHGPGLEEITIPFGDRHFDALEPLCASIGGAGVLESSFPRLSSLSEAYCDAARVAARKADVVVFSHPWAYPVVCGVIDSVRQLVIYDAHNVEGPLLHTLLDALPRGRDLADEGERVERELCAAADLVFACSQDDATTFARLYGLPAAKMRVVPNGVFASDVAPATRASRWMARARLRLGRAPVALFIGENWPPNIEAAEFIRDHVAQACPRVRFVILGAAGNPLSEAAARGNALPRNLRLLGRVNDAHKLLWLAAADIGINPMFSGGGTNIKMVEYMSAGLPVVSTRFGARGIDDGRTCIVAEPSEFAARVAALAADAAARRNFAARGRGLVERRLDWANISPEAGAVIAQRCLHKGRPAPCFTVLVATVDRHDKLRRLLDLLAMQTERDFEVVVVDQSESPPNFRPADFGLRGALLHTRVKGASRARNIASCVARGRIYACTDDDCEPAEEWLAEARRMFDHRPIVGIEGRIYSDRYLDPAWRSVHNYGAEGVGFMTGNLFATADAFHAVGGFDSGFDAFGAREDTDLGWRLMGLGEIPFSEAVLVYHPPWSRHIPRESLAERDRMFEADALLLFKHPDRFRELFLREGQWRRGAAYWVPFMRGARTLGLELPDYIEERRREHGGGT